MKRKGTQVDFKLFFLKKIKIKLELSAGMLIANDLDMKRCYMLVHQTLKRFRIANCVITCNDASKLPNMKGKVGGI